jgi:alkanesulfonate monooxygenase SsuD/methylene tetrahydromethanopterin reductase-like flavin-dependent oxidoreductase (luciferase family)
MDLVQMAELLGYRRYWFAEHHLNSGVAGSAPALLIAMAGATTERIRLGSGGVQSGHRTALSVVEEFGLLDAMHPGRIDLGIGRSGGRTFFKDKLGHSDGKGASSEQRKREDRYTDNGLLIPVAPSLRHLAAAPRITLTARMLQQEGAQSAEYGTLVGDILGLLEGSYRSDDGLDPHPVPGTGARVEPWILGSSPGESAEVAGRLGLRFAASYHISPATALSAARAYREAFVPSAELRHPYLAVSADVVVGPDDETARCLAAGYAEWVRSIRCGEGAMPFPDPVEASRRQWTPEDEALVHDRVASQIVGSPGTVVEGLARLQEATQADELIVTTITHSHQDRVRSFALLANAWSD